MHPLQQRVSCGWRDIPISWRWRRRGANGRLGKELRLESRPLLEDLGQSLLLLSKGVFRLPGGHPGDIPALYRAAGPRTCAGKTLPTGAGCARHIEGDRI